MPSLDNILKEIDYALNVLFEPTKTKAKDLELNNQAKKESQRVMRVNHMGEVCAQALYRGQAISTNDASLKKIILEMCNEEKEHLDMLNVRMSELDGKTSYLNTIWYISSFALGTYVGTLEKNKSFGFIYETEEQVEAHLDEYSKKLPSEDEKSKKILSAIKIDETKHKNTAKDYGSTELSDSAKKLMSVSSKIMKRLSFYI
jgi:ubiquinone biosynthesis monooxygenase Coq7